MYALIFCLQIAIFPKVNSNPKYFNINKNCLFTKGEENGDIQNIEKIYLDCDSDTLLFLVDQKGMACHRNKRTCFDV